MATLLPPGEQQWTDANGAPLAGGKVYFYTPNTSTPKATWEDPNGVTQNPNPVPLDTAGRAIIYGAGSYRQVVQDSAGNLIYDQLTADTASGGTAQGGTSSGTANAQIIAASSFSQQDQQQIVFFVGPGLTNTAAATVAPGGGAGIPVLQDSASGPTPLTGGEMVAGSAVLLTYDLGRGAFHLTGPMVTPVPVAKGGTGATSLAEFLLKDVTNTISVGYTVAPNNLGTISSGTTTLDGTKGQTQYATNNGAFTFAAPAADTEIDLLLTNGASAGAITFSGFTVGANTGSALTTTNGNKFLISFRRINGVSLYSIYALQ